MQILQLTWNSDQWSLAESSAQMQKSPSMVLFFGGTTPAETTRQYDRLRDIFPHADIVGCSTAGEISGYDVTDTGGVAIAIHFEKTRVQMSSLLLGDTAGSYDAGKRLASAVNGEGLKGVIVISDGNQVNGSDLVEGLRTQLGKEVFISGGLAGDGGKFQETGVCHNGPALPGNIAVIGLYGESLQIGWGSVGGWNPFGPLRHITQSDSNVLYELDGKPALALYKSYLGESAAALPGSALHFPIMIRPEGANDQEGLVRTILSLDEEKQSLTFAGNMPKGHTAQLMMASYESLIEGAASAADHAAEAIPDQILGDQLALMISCVGRKIVLGSRIEDEVEAVADAFPPDTFFAGYYSYGEISPQHQGFCELHNQTMTITYLAEKA